MAKLAVALIILVHIHHSIVMIVGEVFQFKVVAVAKAAGIPLFDHQGENNGNAGHENDEALEIEEIDYCSRNGLLIETGKYKQEIPVKHKGQHSPSFALVYFDIITPPPQIAIG